jgi:hypothetical protein
MPQCLSVIHQDQIHTRLQPRPQGANVVESTDCRGGAEGSPPRTVSSSLQGRAIEIGAGGHCQPAPITIHRVPVAGGPGDRSCINPRASHTRKLSVVGRPLLCGRGQPGWGCTGELGAPFHS